MQVSNKKRGGQLAAPNSETIIFQNKFLVTNIAVIVEDSVDKFVDAAWITW